MKPHLNWQQVALCAVLLAAVVLSHIFAPPSVGAVTSIVSTVIGAVFVDLRRKEATKPNGAALSVVRNGEEDDA